MTSTSWATSGRGGRPPLMAGHTYDVDAAQHLLADHADRVIVAFDHDATDPRVFIYTQTPDGVLSPGDYYLWPRLHETSERIKREIGELASSEGRSVGYYDHRRRHKWCRRLPLLTTPDPDQEGDGTGSVRMGIDQQQAGCPDGHQYRPRPDRSDC